MQASLQSEPPKSLTSPPCTKEKHLLNDIPQENSPNTTSISSTASNPPPSRMVSQGRATTRSLQSAQKKQIPLQRTQQRKLIWTDELQQIFLQAVAACDKKVSPKRVLHHMNVEGLTRANVASHLQKHRKRIERESAGHSGQTAQEYVDDSSDEEKPKTGSGTSHQSSASGSGMNHVNRNMVAKPKSKSKKHSSSKPHKVKAKYRLKPAPQPEPNAANVSSVSNSHPNSIPSPQAIPTIPVLPTSSSMLSPSLQPLNHPIHSQMQSSFQQFTPPTRAPSPGPGSGFSFPLQSPSPTSQLLPSLEHIFPRKEESFRSASPITHAQSTVISPQPIRVSLATPPFIMQNRNPSPTPFNMPPNFQNSIANYSLFPFPNSLSSNTPTTTSSSPIPRAVSPSIAKILNPSTEAYGQFDEAPRFTDSLSTMNWSM
eukprot:TRINITY_DN10919_c0_g1_i1.p1 TRINITY_DN10919_c0_g1~~TRINITY_DN10919_c0_g1_i1.p1  ORF type:complete len:428 (+),score=43.71 TRINITY_DN10919_c0_g1_i1:149-1432(+)